MANRAKKPFYKRWWVWALAGIIIFSFALGGEDDQPTPVGPPEENAANDTNNRQNDTNGQDNADNEGAKEDPTKKEFSVGEAVKLGDNVITLTDVKKSSGSQYDKPQQGKEFVIVTVKIDNAGQENISYNPFDFKMANSQGQINDQAFTTVDTETSLQSGELAPGGSVTGTIAFEQPAGDPKLQLQFTPSFWSDKMVKINLQ